MKTEKMPVTGCNGFGFLMLGTAHAGAYAMADAWGIGDNQRWAWVGFRLGDSLDGLVVVGSHGNLSHVNIAVGDGHSG